MCRNATAYGQMCRQRADVQDRHPVGMQYHLGYLKALQAQIIFHARWKAWMDMYTLTNLAQLGVPFATKLLEDPAGDSQLTAIVGAILGDLEAQIFQLLETNDGRQARRSGWRRCWTHLQQTFSASGAKPSWRLCAAWCSGTLAKCMQ